jgi:hypothetical protein
MSCGDGKKDGIWNSERGEERREKERLRWDFDGVLFNHLIASLN